jgi:hypothetical protein
MNGMLCSVALLSVLTLPVHAQDLEALERDAAAQGLYACMNGLAFIHIVDEQSPDYVRSSILSFCAKAIDRANNAFATRFLPPDVRFADQAIDTVISRYEDRLNKHKQMYQRRH